MAIQALSIDPVAKIGGVEAAVHAVDVEGIHLPILPTADPAPPPDVIDSDTDYFPLPYKKYIRPKRDPQCPPKWVKGEDGWRYKNPEYDRYISSMATPSGKRQKTSK